MARNFQLEILTDTKATHKFDANPEMQVEALKNEIAQRIECEPSNIMLYAETRLLENGNKLGFYQITGPALIVMFYRESSITIFLQHPNGAVKPVQINATDTFESLQQLAGKAFGIPNYAPNFSFNNSSIQKGQNLFAIGIHRGVTIPVIAPVPGGVRNGIGTNEFGAIGAR